MEEIVKAGRLGTPSQYQTLISEVLASDKPRNEDEIRTYSMSKSVSLGAAITGILFVLTKSGYLLEKDGEFLLNNLDGGDWRDDVLNSFLATINIREIREAFPAKNVNDALVVENHLIPVRLSNFKRFLTEFGVLKRRVSEHYAFEVDPDFFSLFVPESPSEHDYEEIKIKKLSLKERRELQLLLDTFGLEAEEFVLNYERKRLGEDKGKDVIHVSLYDDSSGYDVSSYMSSASETHDRHIEVKSYRDKPAFFLSANEYACAKKLGNDYFLYLVDRNHIHQSDYKPLIVRNPVEAIFKSDSWICTVDKWRVFIGK